MLTEVEVFAAVTWECATHCQHGACVGDACVCSSGDFLGAACAHHVLDTPVFLPPVMPREMDVGTDEMPSERGGSTPNPKPQTLHPKPETLKHSTPNPKPQTLNPEPWTIKPQPWTLNPNP